MAIRCRQITSSNSACVGALVGNTKTVYHHATPLLNRIECQGGCGGTTTFNIRDRRQGDGFELSARGEYLRATIDDQKLLGRSKRQRGTRFNGQSRPITTFADAGSRQLGVCVVGLAYKQATLKHMYATVI